MLTLVMVSVKASSEKVHSNAHNSMVAGIDLEELNKLERAMYSLLDYQVHCKNEEIESLGHVIFNRPIRTSRSLFPPSPPVSPSRARDLSAHQRRSAGLAKHWAKPISSCLLNRGLI
jgi:hypothetical protein